LCTQQIALRLQILEQNDSLTSVSDALTASNSETFTYTPRESLSTATRPYGALAYAYDAACNTLSEPFGAHSWRTMPRARQVETRKHKAMAHDLPRSMRHCRLA
jgi:hypothetical protein